MFEELDFYEVGQLFDEEDIFGVHLDDGIHLH